MHKKRKKERKNLSNSKVTCSFFCSHLVAETVEAPGSESAQKVMAPSFPFFCCTKHDGDRRVPFFIYNVCTNIINPTKTRRWRLWKEREATQHPGPALGVMCEMWWKRPARVRLLLLLLYLIEQVVYSSLWGTFWKKAKGAAFIRLSTTTRSSSKEKRERTLSSRP